MFVRSGRQCHPYRRSRVLGGRPEGRRAEGLRLLLEASMQSVCARYVDRRPSLDPGRPFLRRSRWWKGIRRSDDS